MSNELVKFVDLVPMPASMVLKRRAEVKNIGKEVMQKADLLNGIYGHYGIIPGTKNNCLLKPGAQLLCMVFHITPKYESEKIELENGHREYETVCNGHQAGTDVFLGQGVGSCSTLESKYRYRYDKREGVNTNKPLPGNYWGEKKKNTKEGTKAAMDLIGGPTFFPKKLDDGRWMIFKKTEKIKIENPDIADQYNTVKKQSAKRALVDMVLTVLAAGDMFTQDQYETIVSKIQSGEDIDVPWSYTEETEPEPEKPKENNFDPKTFSGSKTEKPETSSPTPPSQEKAMPAEVDRETIKRAYNMLTDNYKHEIILKVFPNEPQRKKIGRWDTMSQEILNKVYATLHGTEILKKAIEIQKKAKEQTIQPENKDTQGMRDRVVAFVRDNPDELEYLKKLLQPIFPEANLNICLNVGFLSNAESFIDDEIAQIHKAIEGAGLYK